MKLNKYIPIVAGLLILSGTVFFVASDQAEAIPAHCNIDSAVQDCCRNGRLIRTLDCSFPGADQGGGASDAALDKFCPGTVVPEGSCL